MSNEVKHTSVSVRLINSQILSLPISLASGILCGHIYSRATNLPTSQLYKLWFAFNCAQSALLFLVNFGIKERKNKAFTTICISVLTTMIGMNELSKRSQVNNRVLLACLAVQNLYIMTMLALAHRVYKETEAMEFLSTFEKKYF